MVAAPIAVPQRGGDGQRADSALKAPRHSPGQRPGFFTGLKRRPEGAQEVSIEPAPTTRLDWINGRHVFYVRSAPPLQGGMNATAIPRALPWAGILRAV